MSEQNTAVAEEVYQYQIKVEALEAPRIGAIIRALRDLRIGGARPHCVIKSG